MKSLKIELTQEELVCLLFWHAHFEMDTIGKVLDNELFEKLKGLYDDMEPEDTYLSVWTPVPKYQPGENYSADERFWPPIFFG